MYRLLIVALLTVAAPACNAFAAGAFPWFHTRPKSVVLDDPAPSVSTRVAYHGSAVYPGTGRLYFVDGVDRLKQEQSAKFHLSTIFPINWLTGWNSPKASTPRSKSK
ncbi:MAG TPA: hypothetical protein VG297_04555 [Bryobacteraceae bacterium]|jgi:hypothetical protein|nr:hypothetical protein [Bryobacteraceae bacterium]